MGEVSSEIGNRIVSNSATARRSRRSRTNRILRFDFSRVHKQSQQTWFLKTECVTSFPSMMMHHESNFERFLAFVLSKKVCTFQIPTRIDTSKFCLGKTIKRRPKIRLHRSHIFRRIFHTMIAKTAVFSSLLLAPTTTGFLNTHVTKSARSGAVVTKIADVQDIDDSLPLVPTTDVQTQVVEEDCRLPTQKGKQMSESIPFLKCPPVLAESGLAGNVGFDPLGLATSEEQLNDYREAEIKHARLAMLAAVGWPLSELEDRDIASYFNIPSVLDDGDRVPSILNGGMERIDPRFWGFCLGMSAAIDMYGISKARRESPDYFPGNLGFDPLNLFPPDREGRENMKLAEIKHGRVAMVGVTGYVLEEYFTKMAVVDDTPILFQPITETVEEVIGSVEGAIAASMVL